MEEKELNLKSVVDGLHVMDSLYLGWRSFAACYILERNGEAAIIETSTNHAVPLLLRSLDQLGLSRDQVKYVIITHIHLDHAGGAGLLMEQLPGARLAVHPRGARHMIDPGRLIASVKQVYGEQAYQELYGDIRPVPGERIHGTEDGESLKLGGYPIRIMETLGHARHHYVALDEGTGSLFSGDSFGIGYPRFQSGSSHWIFPSTAPVQFDPGPARDSFRSIRSLKPDRIMLTHFGCLEDIQQSHEQLEVWIDFMADRGEKLKTSAVDVSDLTGLLKDEFWARADSSLRQFRGQGLTDEDREFLKIDIDLNAQGVAHYFMNSGG